MAVTDIEAHLQLPTPVQKIKLPGLFNQELEGAKSQEQFYPDINIFLKRDDLIHPHICGNKWRKLKYNIQEADRQESNVLISFGGAYSNHLVAVAAAGYYGGYRTVGIIRSYHAGKTVAEAFGDNPTIALLQQYGMELYIVHPDHYKHKEKDPAITAIIAKYPHAFLIPEGGTNELAMHGVGEIIDEVVTQCPEKIDVIIAGIGTGGTLAGLAKYSSNHTWSLIGVSPFKGEVTDLAGWQHLTTEQRYSITHWKNHSQLRFGKMNTEHRTLLKEFYDLNGVQLDPIYTVKVIHTLRAKIRNGYFKKGTNILIIHTGGLQGIAGYEHQYNCEL